MKNLFKGKFGTVVILLFTVILAGVAIFTALRLYQLRSQPVAPNVPSSIPKAAENVCTLSFTIGTASPSPTPAGCNQDCNASVNPPISCTNGLSCYVASGITGAGGVCRNPSCQTESGCICTTATPTSTPTTTPSGTPNSCGGTCGSNANCNGGLYCNTSVGFCRNASCPNQADCNCPGTSTPKGTGTPGPTPTAPTLPVSGTDWPTVVGAGVGVFVIIGSLLLAL